MGTSVTTCGHHFPNKSWVRTHSCLSFSTSLTTAATCSHQPKLAPLPSGQCPALVSPHRHHQPPAQGWHILGHRALQVMGRWQQQCSPLSKPWCHPCPSPGAIPVPAPVPSLSRHLGVPALSPSLWGSQGCSSLGPGAGESLLLLCVLARGHRGRNTLISSLSMA